MNDLISCFCCQELSIYINLTEHSLAVYHLVFTFENGLVHSAG
uniref:Uncharacterized protein n=1 Tax=Arundo donax TaxID=35708 RepID=A0A0A8Y9C0_ARUDO